MSKKKIISPKGKKNLQNAPLKAIDFFCGAGGVTCGFRKAGIKVLGGVDIDNSCKETYEKNNPGSKFMHADISELTFDKLQNELNIARNDNDLIFVGCSPCQYYTIINTSKEKSAKSKLLLEDFQRFVDHFKPGYVFVENVPGLEKKAESPLADFKKFLAKSGYVFDDKVINASHYNVPQSRKRYVLVATRINSDILIPKPVINKKLTVRNVIGLNKGFPVIQAGHRDNSAFLHSAASLSEDNLERLKLTPRNGGTRKAWKDIARLQLKCYEGKDNIFTNVYGRMFWDQPAPTITTKFYSISNGRFAHPDQNRAISLREGSALQSFPKTYKFIASSTGIIARMIGNAVPPEMAKKIGESFLKNRNTWQNSKQGRGH
ncbi:MAG: DNA cytosine methyltransferase [Bacteroidetes bacterium]|nr:DNA cytosine methyltransferase [Bacteroidota bacterium]